MRCELGNGEAARGGAGPRALVPPEVHSQYSGMRRSQAPDAAVTTAVTRDGGAVVGGTWELAGHASAALPQPPLTAAGMAGYAGVLAASEITITGTLPKGDTTGTVVYFIIDTTKSIVVSQVVLPNAAKQINSVSLTVKVPSATGSYAIGTFDSGGNFKLSTFLHVTSPPTGPAPSGAIGPKRRKGAA